MKTSSRGLDIIMEHEGFEPDPYRCPTGYWTIGFGSRFYADGREVQRTDPPIDRIQALVLLKETLVEYEDAVMRLVKVPLTQGQFDALVSFTYNLGAGALARSTLLRLLNAGDFVAAQGQFERWNKGQVNGKSVVLPGLVRRRRDEATLFGA